MKNDPTPLTYTVLPVHIIEAPGGLVVKRGCVELNINGDGAGEIVYTILRAAARGAGREELLQSFAAVKRTAVEALLDQLVARNILVPRDRPAPEEREAESPPDIFFWHFGQPAKQAFDRVRAGRIVIVGVNCIARQMIVSLARSGIESIDIVDDPVLRNVRFFDERGILIPGEWPDDAGSPLHISAWSNDFDAAAVKCVVATSDYGGVEGMREWNRFCVRNKVRFLPVILRNMIGNVGPFVVPAETACYECFYIRETSRLENPELRRAIDAKAFDAQGVIGFLPSMASQAGDLAVTELLKSCCDALPMRNVGALIEMNLLAPQLTLRRVLKLPSCAVCSPLNSRPPVTPRKVVFASLSARAIR